MMWGCLFEYDNILRESGYQIARSMIPFENCIKTTALGEKVYPLLMIFFGVGAGRFTGDFYFVILAPMYLVCLSAVYMHCVSYLGNKEQK